MTRCNRGCSTITFVINSFIKWVSLFLQSFKYLPNTANAKPEKLGSCNFETMFIPHYVSCVMCHSSHVMCHMSRVTCHVLRVTCNMYFFFVSWKKIRQSGWASRWRVCFQQGLPRLVFKLKLNFLKKLQICLSLVKIKWAWI